MTTLLAERDLTPQEREAVADEPRAGVWRYEVMGTGALYGDDRKLSQDDTDAAIATELLLVRETQRDERKAIREALGVFRLPEIVVEAQGVAPRRVTLHNMLTQRGGIHSEPLVRLLAFRAWGDRDRKWFERVRPDLSVGERSDLRYDFDTFTAEYDQPNRRTIFTATANGRTARAAITDESIANSQNTDALRREVLRTLGYCLDLAPLSR